MARWLDALDVKQWGESILSALVSSPQLKPKDPSDLYALTADQLADLELQSRKLGVVTAEKLIQNLQRAKSVPLDVLLNALVIPHAGPKIGETLRLAGRKKKGV